MILCSACLLGINCRYNGKTKPNKTIIKLAESEILIPVCPEQLGGLLIPRSPAEISGDKVFNKEGVDVTKEFKKGAGEVLKIAKRFKIKKAILKARSPSCGSGFIYDGTFSRTLIKGDGVTAKLLKENGVEIITKEELDINSVIK